MAINVSGLPEGWIIKAIRYGGRDIRGLVSDLYDGARTSQLEIVATNRVAAPSVRLVGDPDVLGQPWMVVLFPTDPARWHAGMSSQSPSTGDTRKLGSLLPGEYFVAVLGQADLWLVIQDPSRLDQLSKVAARVAFAEGDRRTLELPLTRLPEAGR